MSDNPGDGLVKVSAGLPDGSPTAEETMWAFPLGDDLYRLDNTPWFAEGIAIGDVVKCESSREGLPIITGVVVPSGNLTVRVFVPETPDRERVKQELRDLFSRKGCKYEGFGATKGLIAATIPQNQDPEPLLESLRQKQEEGVAFWESGNF